eukprot:gb/GFBE01027760.1/.p1 GENE.gb/GFBE01027760.1/~~gb/GFBE01027760.1/.p1  ORF type:complete len:134 (+),score=20.00 gb/GFBE01027760.1/:1-402(+)
MLKSLTKLVSLDWQLDGLETSFLGLIGSGRATFCCTRLNAREMDFQVSLAAGLGTLKGTLRLQEGGHSMRFDFTFNSIYSGTTHFRRASSFPPDQGSRVSPTSKQPSSCKRQARRKAKQIPLQSLGEHYVYCA